MGAIQGKLDTKTREAYGTPPTISPTCPFPRGSVFCRWAGPAQGTEDSVTRYALPSCSSSHLPSSTHPAGPVVGTLPDFFQLSPRERQGRMLGTHWTRPTGQHWFLGGDGTPQLSSCHTLDTARIEGDEGDKEGQPSTMVLSPGFLLQPPTPPRASDTLDLGVTPAVILSHTPLLPTHRHVAARTSAKPLRSCGVNIRMGNR